MRYRPARKTDSGPFFHSCGLGYWRIRVETSAHGDFTYHRCDGCSMTWQMSANLQAFTWVEEGEVLVWMRTESGNLYVTTVPEHEASKYERVKF